MFMEKRKGISGSTLKLIAVVTMLVDHLGAALMGRLLWANGYMELVASSDMNVINQWFWEYGSLYYGYTAMRMIGRVAFPIFCFLLVEGFLRTGNVRRYALRLGLFALISEIPFDLAFKARVLEFTYQNIYFTLLIGLLTMVAFDRIGKKDWSWWLKLLASGVSLLAGAGLAEILRTDYGATGVVCIIVLYVFRFRKPYQILAGCLVFLWETTAPLAFIPVAFYNGRRGMKLKYLFYLFYPLHLLVIYLICVAVGLGGYTAL